MKTIVGIATPVGFGGIGIVRLSGPQALSIAKKLCHKNLKPRHATLCTVTGPQFTDTALVIYFPAPHSFTGDDVVEIHAHGGWHLVNRIRQATLALGAVAAAPGEFTKHAVLNHKMALTQAESTLDLIHAESDAELSNAAQMLNGALHQQLSQIEHDLIDVRAQIDAYLDYPEDLDAPELPLKAVKNIRAQIDKLLATASDGQIIKNGINVCLLGYPNAGKSSLFNALVNADRSIVTNIAGTTTDTITERITYRGIKINFLDTAGLREHAANAIEQHGINRTKSAMQDADILVIVIDATTNAVLDFPKNKKHLLVYNKADLCPQFKPDAGLAVSAKTGHNVTAILDKILALATTTAANDGILRLTNTRHINLLTQAQALLTAITPRLALDQISSNITVALSYVGQITGTNINEKTLDEIFSKFCLGK